MKILGMDVCVSESVPEGMLAIGRIEQVPFRRSTEPHEKPVIDSVVYNILFRAKGNL